MGLKRKAKVSAEFSMSSLTDIIFLLLIFFMLTSSLVAPNALNLKLPGSSSTLSTSNEKIPDVTITRSGKYELDGKGISAGNLETGLRRLKSSARGKLDITISPDPEAPVENLVEVMDMAMRLQINAIMAMEK